MEYLTYSDIKQRVQEKTDTEDETFVESAEFLRYCQDAIDFCENKIHKLGVADRYFETVGPLAIVSGRRDYELPSDIYGNKITKMLHKKYGAYYEVPRLHRSDRYVAFHDIEQYGTSADDLSYIILNPSSTQKPVVRFTPRPSFTVATYTTTIDTTSGSKTATVASATGLVVGQFVSSANIPTNTMIEIISGTTITLSASATATASGTSVTFTDPDVLCYYLRNAAKPTADTDYIDIPEFSNYIVQYMVCQVFKKDIGNPALQEALQHLAELEENMTSTLSEMVPDEDNMMEKDLSFYGEFT